MDNRDRLIFALDVPEADQARQLAEQLGDAVTFYKLGLELMMAGGYFELIDWLIERDRKVFVDLKFFDVPATVGRAVARLASRGVTFATVHGNQGIMEAAAAAKGDELKILAVTALTSLDRGDLDDLGFSCDVADLVLSRARRALEAGCDGVVASGLELSGHAGGGGPAPARRDARHPAGREPAQRRSEACRDRRTGVRRRRRSYRRRPADS